MDITQQFSEKQPFNKFRFKCVKGCSLCCSLNDISVYPFDVIRLLAKTGITSKDFFEKHARLVYDADAEIIRCYLRTTPVCRFFDKEKACTVYEHRPIACRTFPAGRMFMKNMEIQHYLYKGDCPGLDTGKKWTVEEWMREVIGEDNEKLVMEWNAFVNVFKEEEGLPRKDPMFILFYKKIFYQFDPSLTEPLGVDVSAIASDDLASHMKLRYQLASFYLDHFHDIQKGFGEWMQKQDKNING